MPTAEERARAEVYRDAAGKHATVAQDLYDSDRFVLANYVSGLAVECILRAYRHMIDPEFDARRDMERLYKLARFADVVPLARVEEISALFGHVVTLWSNDHRSLSGAALRKRWTKRRLYEGIKGRLRQGALPATAERFERDLHFGDRTMEEFIQRLTALLGAEFPGAEFEIEPAGPNRAGGLMTWAGFAGMEQLARQRRVWGVIRQRLGPDEQRRVSMLLTLTPEEMAVAREG